MNDVIKSITGSARVQAILVSWFLPLLLPTFSFVLFVLPSVRTNIVVEVIRNGAEALSLNHTLFILTLTLTASILMFSARLALYQTLEGLNWPDWLRDWRRDRAHYLQYDVLVAESDVRRVEYSIKQTERELEAARRSAPAKEVEALEARLERYRKMTRERETKLDEAKAARARRGRKHRKVPELLTPTRPVFTPKDRSDRLFPYPGKREYVMPTGVGNALHSMETYGITTYGLDSQTLWYELYSNVPAALQSDYVDGQLQSDTFVCLMYGSWAVSLTAGIATVANWIGGTPAGSLPLVVVGGLIAAAAFRRGLLSSISGWGQTVKAIVNMGWPALREVYGLPTPRSPEENREMGTIVTGLSQSPGEPYYLEGLQAFQQRAVDEASDDPTDESDESRPLWRYVLDWAEQRLTARERARTR